MLSYETMAPSPSRDTSAQPTTNAKLAPPSSQSEPRPDVEAVSCDTCGFAEDCTPDYIAHVRETYGGRWLCGLCMEAVDDEMARSSYRISTQEALRRHVRFCNGFKSVGRRGEEEVEDPISALGRILMRSLDSPRAREDHFPMVEDRKPPLVGAESCLEREYR